ncbi:hypothetical protein AMAG_17245 [Allomyces macrogynus ATCC 38327]|uniref:C3H1-type domain-containing protein n=1 Tax=Allomyces macrogynus (strain ATCC 38327) TaxID=578462 RepID=A0A0L0TEH3_ALLM3|nr:hypothetical protein AMAG_17245 [Allomyces macrogynus ATCC 38327]|eukprot:KNE73090.1 hypothetical protein AMAG_17245 [Allomyces macrogynus ATCC 38327]
MPRRNFTVTAGHPTRSLSIRPGVRPVVRPTFRNMTLVRQQPTTDSTPKTPTATVSPVPSMAAPAPSLPSSNPTSLAITPTKTPSTTPPSAFSSASASPAPGTPPSTTVQYVRNRANQLVRKDLISSPSPAPSSSSASAVVTPATPTPSTSPSTAPNSQFVTRGRSLIRKEALRPPTTKTPRGTVTPKRSTASSTGSANSNYVQTSKGSLVRRDLVRKPMPTRRFAKRKSTTGPVILRGKIVALNGANYVQGQDGKLTRLEPGKFIVRNSTNPKAKHCTYFQRFGTCSRGTACTLIHDPVRIAVCRFALFGRDHDATRCKHNHTLTAHNTPHCAHFQRGSCTNAACKFIHVKPAPGAPVCRDFLDGYCPHGAQCTARHVWECPQGTSCTNDKCRWQHPGPRKRGMPVVESPGSAKRARLDEADELPILFRDKDEYWDLGDASDDEDQDVEVAVDQSEDGDVELEWFDAPSGSGSPTSSDHDEAMDEDGGNQDLILLDYDSDEDQEDGEMRYGEKDGGLGSAE